MFWHRNTVPPPERLHIETVKVCNSHCKTCLIWAEREDPAKILPTARRVEIVEEFAQMNPRGRVFLCGGETLLRPERLFALTRRCQDLGLPSQMATNGSLVDAAMAERLILEGPSQIALSLNSRRAAIHDYTRGRGGSFDEVTRAIGLLQAARRRHGRRVRLHVHTIVCELNYRELEAFHAFALEELGVDRVDLGFLQPTFHLSATGGQDRFFAQQVVSDEQALAEIVRRCDARFRLGLRPEWIEQVTMYHRSIRISGEALRGWSGSQGTRDQICATYEKNLVVDPQGVARLCFSPVFRGRRLRRRGDLARFWQGAEDIRRKMRKCRQFCGMVDVFTRIGPWAEQATTSEESNDGAARAA